MKTCIAFAALALLPCLALPGHAAEADTRPRYALKDFEPGSLIKRDVVGGSVIPLTKDYAQLSPEEQSYVKSQYEGMGADDEPPYPIGGLASVYKKIAAAQQKLMVEGPMTVAVEVNSRGEAESVSVLLSPDPEMTRFVAAALMFQTYKPAVCGGTPCRMQYPFRMDFKRRL